MASIRKYKNKKSRKFEYEYRIKYQDPVTGKTREKSKRGFSTNKEAELAAAEIEKQLFLGNVDVVKNSEVTVEQWYVRYIELYGKQLSENTLVVRKGKFQNHILPALGKLKLQTLSRSRYQQFINDLSDKMSAETVKGIHSMFMTLVNKAVAHEIIDRNKLKGIVINKKNEDEKLKYLNRDELDLFMEEAKRLCYDQYVMLFILVRTGLRKGELLALEWPDIDIEEQTLTVNKTRSHIGTTSPKTKKSNRTISLDSTLVGELKKLKTWQKENKLKKGTAYQQSNYVAVNDEGDPYHEWKLNRIIRDLCDVLGWKRFGPHALRHTHAVMLLESGVDIKTVSDRLGHTKIDMTANVYLHVSRKQEHTAVSKLEKYLS